MSTEWKNADMCFGCVDGIDITHACVLYVNKYDTQEDLYMVSDT